MRRRPIRLAGGGSNPDPRRCDALFGANAYCQNYKVKNSTRCHEPTHQVGAQLDQMLLSAAVRHGASAQPASALSSRMVDHVDVTPPPVPTALSRLAADSSRKERNFVALSTDGTARRVLAAQSGLDDATYMMLAVDTDRETRRAVEENCSAPAAAREKAARLNAYLAVAA
jgi:hypothetical protein